MGYRNVPVLITGGLGFIGSNLAIRLVEEGARVTIVDPMIAGCGGNLYNIEPVRDRVEVIPIDIAEAEQFAPAIRQARVIFNLAGEISHLHSMEFPERDLLINTVSQLRFLQSVSRHNPGVRVVYASTRQVYGRAEYLPVDEKHPIRPVDFNGVHKNAANKYHLMMSQRGWIDAINLRLTNVYGPRMALGVPCQGFLSEYLRRMVTGRDLEVFGDGKQLRDPLFVDDAVEAFLLAGLAPPSPTRIYNVGGPEALGVGKIAAICARLTGHLTVRYRPFPEERAAIDIGSYYTDYSLIKARLGWQPAVRFEEGITSTLAFYRAQLRHYLDPDNPQPHCSLPEHQGIPHRLMYASV